MKKPKPAVRAAYRSKVRQSRAARTRRRIENATAALLADSGAAESITFRAVASRAGVAEMTVYRHFPTRDALIRGLWDHLDEQVPADAGLPSTAAALLGKHETLFADFERTAPQIIASLTTSQGRRLHSALTAKRRRAFFAIIDEVAPQLTAARRLAAAAIIQLLHSPHAWDALRQQWGMGSRAAGNATLWAIEVLLDTLVDAPANGAHHSATSRGARRR